MKQLIRFKAMGTALLMGSLLILPVQAAPGPGPDGSPHEVYPFPSRGAVVDRLPRNHRVVNFRGQPYHFHKGIWYRPVGSRFMVVTPPPGLVVPVLPTAAVTVTIGGIPYYQYGGTYYVKEPGGYRVVERPAAAPKAADPISDDLFVYPRKGQSAEQQASDRFECHAWASDQTGYDPTLTGGGVSSDDRARKRSDYLRAMTACLEARGYSVR